MHIRTLSGFECTDLLAGNRVAFLACTKDDQPYVVPIHYAYSDGHVYAFSMPGKKIEWMRANPRVSVFVKQQGAGKAWKSVVAEGHYEELPDEIGHKVVREHAWSVLSKHYDWWEPGALKPFEQPPSRDSSHVFFRILVEQMSGREARE
ncbi:pyridoxamine 5'-phosphate oxidase family protein [Pseudaminobacter soli (ex Li et al. 2025)]|uniref:Flavin-nucleotide-binding protein n=1 Tax=Pseudaminobacter soli (ex Li et al. 2025) TaxID=1295366 RepID=A0A2P7S2F3_9HYPH|nr:pyridoxamine 5'-phosphate oxidase family protein [Mesorhizobium soli]PSJ56606.1 flavin-nucleotide-binding protein [Mesorhizobium soli]